MGAGDNYSKVGSLQVPQGKKITFKQGIAVSDSDATNIVEVIINLLFDGFSGLAPYTQRRVVRLPITSGYTIFNLSSVPSLDAGNVIEITARLLLGSSSRNCTVMFNTILSDV